MRLKDMQRRALLTLLTGIAAAAPRQFGETELRDMEREIHERVGRERRSRRLGPLEWMDVVAREARRHARGIAEGEVRFGHDGFEARMQRIAKAIPYRGGAENVAMEWPGPDAPARAVKHWLASSGHARNIRFAKYTMTGVGAAQAGNGSLYFVQLFVTGAQTD